MKLLFDQNLSPRLVHLLTDLYPGSIHTDESGLAEASDYDIWEFARERDLIVVTKDKDFDDISVTKGHPPKLLSIRRGNCSTKEIEELLRTFHEAVVELNQNDDVHILILR